jgi:OOP family OmpA-OmpF porin
VVAVPVQLPPPFIVHFANKSAVLRPAEVVTLRAMLGDLNKSTLVVHISGFTDSRGSERLNSSLALQRARSVRAWLVGHGVQESRLDVVGSGRCCYVSSNVTASGRLLNRRAVVSFSMRVN